MEFIRKITEPQKSDMGHGIGIYEFDKNSTLKDFLKMYKETSSSWGEITIYSKEGHIVRKFDYDTHRHNNFYHHLNIWDYQAHLKHIKFFYCFMQEDVDIYLQ